MADTAVNPANPAQATPAPAAPTLPVAPDGVQVTPNTNGGMNINVPMTGDASQGALKTPQLAPVQGAQIVPAGTEGAITFKDANGQEISVIPAPANQAPQSTVNVPPAPENTVPFEQAQEQQNTAEQTIAKDLESKGIDFQSVFDEYNNSGQLGATTRETLNKAGYPNEVIDSIIAGHEAIENRFVESVYQAVGGKDAWNEIYAYASKDEAVAKTINAVVATGDLAQIKLITEGVQARMNQQYGTANPTIMGGATGQQGVVPFGTSAEVVKAMSDPRYQTDAAYTQEVYRRLAQSNVL